MSSFLSLPTIEAPRLFERRPGSFDADTRNFFIKGMEIVSGEEPARCLSFMFDFPSDDSLSVTCLMSDLPSEIVYHSYWENFGFSAKTVNVTSLDPEHQACYLRNVVRLSKLGQRGNVVRQQRQLIDWMVARKRDERHQLIRDAARARVSTGGRPVRLPLVNRDNIVASVCDQKSDPVFFCVMQELDTLRPSAKAIQKKKLVASVQLEMRKYLIVKVDLVRMHAAIMKEGAARDELNQHTYLLDLNTAFFQCKVPTCFAIENVAADEGDEERKCRRCRSPCLNITNIERGLSRDRIRAWNSAWEEVVRLAPIVRAALIH